MKKKRRWIELNRAKNFLAEFCREQGIDYEKAKNRSARMVTWASSFAYLIRMRRIGRTGKRH